MTIEYNNIILKKYINGSPIEMDLRNQMVSITINESIRKKLVSGQIVITDISRILYSMPFDGKDEIIIKVTDEFNNEITLEYLVIDVSFFRSADTNNAHCLIEFIDKSYTKFIEEYSTSLSNQSITSFVSDFSSNVFEKDIDIIEESTPLDKNIAFPYNKFTFMLNYLNRFAESITGSHGYMYFTTLLNTIFYVTYGYLLNLQKPISTLYEKSKTESRNLPWVFYSYSFKHPNVYQKQISRQTGSTHRYFDFNTKKPITNEFTYSNVVSDQKGLTKYGTISSDLENPKYFNFLSSFESFDNQIIIENNNMDFYLIINCNGTITRNVGQLVNVEFNDYLGVDVEPNNIYTGNYLIEQIKHVFTPQEYTQEMILSRNGYDVAASSTQYKY